VVVILRVVEVVVGMEVEVVMDVGSVEVDMREMMCNDGLL